MNDLIDRQAAIDAVEESRRLNHHQDGKAACAHEYEHRHFLKILRDLPSAQPEQKQEKGKWIKKMSIIEKERYILHDPVWGCSCCNKEYDPVIAKMINFCPNCGADMRGEKDG